jgi:hypothetical protein
MKSAQHSFFKTSCTLLLVVVFLSSCEVEQEFTYSMDICHISRKYTGSSGGSGKSEPSGKMDFHTYMNIWLFDTRIPWDDALEETDFGTVAYAQSNSAAIYLHPGIGWTQKGGRYGETKHTFNYIDAPITVRYRQQNVSGSSWSAGLGPYFAYAFGGTIKSTNSGQTTKTKIDFGNGPYKRLDAGVVVSGGYTFRQGFVVGLQYMHGLSNISSSNFSKTKNRLIGIELGYSMRNLFSRDKNK